MPRFMVAQTIGFVAGTLDYLLWLYWLILLVRVLLSWVNPDPRQPLVRFIYNVTEPVLYPVRRRLPFLHTSGIDLTPLVVLLGVKFLQSVVVASLYHLAGEIQLRSSTDVHWLRGV